MPRLYDRAALFAAALWWGSLSAIGFMAVPLLFAHLPTPALAGNTAAHLFTAQSWVSLACGLVLLLVSRSNQAAESTQLAREAMIFIVLGMLLALLIEYAVAPRIVARQNLRWWHGAGSLMYGLQWLCAAVVLWRQAPARRPAG